MKRILLLCILLAGCDKEIKREEVGEPVVVDKNVSCHVLSYCYTCMPGFSTSGCNFKTSAFCPGNQLARVEVRNYKVHYESGNIMMRTRETTLETLEECK